MYIDRRLSGISHRSRRDVCAGNFATHEQRSLRSAQSPGLRLLKFDHARAATRLLLPKSKPAPRSKEGFSAQRDAGSRSQGSWLKVKFELRSIEPRNERQFREKRQARFSRSATGGPFRIV